MDVKSALFYAFSAVLLFAAFRVITARNPVYAALYLIFAFFQAAAIWMLLRAEVLAATGGNAIPALVRAGAAFHRPDRKRGKPCTPRTDFPP